MGKIYRITAYVLSVLFIALGIAVCIPEARTLIADYGTKYSNEYAIKCETIDEQSEQISSLNEDIDALLLYIEDNEETISTLQSQVRAKNTEIETLQTQKETLQNGLSETTNQLNETLADVEELETELATANGNITTLQTQLATKQSELAELTSQLATATSDNETLQSQYDAKLLEIAELENDIADAEDEISALNTQLAAANNQVSTLQTQVANQTSQIASLQSDIASVESELEAKTEQIESLLNRIAELEEQLNSQEPIEPENPVEWVIVENCGLYFIETDGTNIAYRFDVENAVGYNNPQNKMSSKSSPYNQSSWSVELPEGTYEIQYCAKMTYSAHGDRHYYNQWQEDIQAGVSNPDNETDDPYRYYITLNNGDITINPETALTWAELGLRSIDGDDDFVWHTVNDSVIIDSPVTSIELNHGNIGFSLFMSGIRLIKLDSVDPVDPDPVDPVNPDPVDPDPVDPVNPDPVDPDPIDPVDPVDPVDPDPIDPVDPDSVGYELYAEDVIEGINAPDVSNPNTRLGKGIYDDVWDITGIAPGTYALYIQGKTQTGNHTHYWCATTDVATGMSTPSSNGNIDLNDEYYRYGVRIDDGEYINVGNYEDTYEDTGIITDSINWSNKALAIITINEGASTINLHSFNRGFAIWVFGIRLVPINQ